MPARAATATATASASASDAAASAFAAAAADAAATLVWVNDTEPGIRRQPDASGFVYLGPDGRRLDDDDVLRRIRRLAIPPAYQDVWICARADGHLQATGRDARGRKQYRYHPQWVADRGQAKFDQLRRFGSVLPAIRRQVQRELDSGDAPTRSRVLATLVRLLDTTWMRIGNEEYARSNGSYGLSTLQTDHAGLRGTELRLSFVGKSGVRHSVRLDDRRVARVVRRCKDLPGRELFQYVDAAGEPHRIDSGDVNAWLAATAGIRVTAKDFRTWHGSVEALQLALAALRQDAPPTAKSIIADVARRLGNTVAVCRKAYIHPTVLAVCESLCDSAACSKLRARPWVDKPPALRGLSIAERRLMGLMRSRSAVKAAALTSGLPSPRRAPGAVVVSRRWPAPGRARRGSARGCA